MVIQLRASMGAGKSTLVRRLLVEHGGQLIEKRAFVRERDGKKINVHLWRCDNDLFVLGRYDLETTSGKGGDFVNGPVGRDIIRHYAHLPHLVWESAWGSTEFGTDEWLDEVRRLGILWATLDTPLDTCIERIYKRRQERGANVGAALNEKKLLQNHARVHALAARGTAAGIHGVTLNDAHAYEQLHDLLVHRGWTCDQHRVSWDWTRH
jgi:hypothetical protein